MDWSKVNLTTLLIGLLGALNTALMSFNAYHLNDVQLDAVIKTLSALAMFAGVCWSHRKDIVSAIMAQPPTQALTPTAQVPVQYVQVPVPAQYATPVATAPAASSVATTTATTGQTTVGVPQT